MVGVWLYAADGRQLYYVAVACPMPKTLSYGGTMFAWDAVARRYVEGRLYDAHDADTHPGLKAARPEDYPQ